MRTILVFVWLTLLGCNGSGAAGGAIAASADNGSATGSTDATGSTTDWSRTTLASAQENVVVLREAAGTRTADYPLQFARIFRRGEIAHQPQLLVDGTALATQADVKTRWKDGSVQHAVLSAYLPVLEANATHRIQFADQPLVADESRGLGAAEMLDARFDFDATIELRAGNRTVIASGRDMLRAGHFTYWLHGPIATSVILADHGEARTHDLGFDTHRSFRPVFHATFWPRINKVFVRYIGEVSNMSALQDMRYDLRLAAGLSSPTEHYLRTGVVHYIGQRWTRKTWIGGQPGPVGLDHGLAYLASTQAIANYRTDVAVSETTIATNDDAWRHAARHVLEPGLWDAAMPSGGGRPDLGILPKWMVLWLYTGDPRSAELAIGQAELAAGWPMNFRESLPDRPFDIGTDVRAIGRIPTLSSRPTFATGVSNVNLATRYSLPADNVTIVGPFDRSAGGWLEDNAHQPDPFSLPYMLTGEYFFLEQLQSWAAWSTFIGQATTDRADGRGPTLQSGSLVDMEARAFAWSLRSRALTAFLSPDGTLEKAYFDRLTNNALAIAEGIHRVTDGVFHRDANWTWGSTFGQSWWNGHGPGLLGNFGPTYEFNSAAPDHAIPRPGTVAGTESPWQTHFCILALARAAELGFPARALQMHLARMPIGIVTESGSDPWLVGAYTLPIIDSRTMSYFTNWADVAAIIEPLWDGHDSRYWFANWREELNHGYPNIAAAAVAMSIDAPDAREAWAFLKREVYDKVDFSTNPMLAIEPR